MLLESEDSQAYALGFCVVGVAVAVGLVMKKVREQEARIERLESVEAARLANKVRKFIREDG